MPGIQPKAVTDPLIKRILKLDPFPQPELILTQYPVVLMHGFGILGAVGKAGHLDNMAMELRRHCTVSYAPNVAPYVTVKARCELWHERLKVILAETGAPRLNIIAHSMGGLDARYLISVLGAHEYVASLTTIGAPHRGSAVASWLLEQPEQVQAWISDVLDWLGESAYADYPSSALLAISELTTDYICQTFNPQVPDHPDVQYASYAGIAGKGAKESIHPFLRLPNAILFRREGLNDGLVALESAKWGTFRGTIDADHARQIGIQVTAGSYNATAFFVSIVKQLREAGL